jgi:uncharacterized membrane protein YbaN (DUF454 family)
MSSPTPNQENGPPPPGGGGPTRTQRVVLLGVGYLCLGLAALGAVLPLMPTTVFLIVAAWAFGRASPALRARLLNDPRIGPTLRNWQEHGTVSPRAKRAAVLAMALSWAVVTVVFRDVLASALSGLCLACVAAWLLTRPSEPASAVPRPAGDMA